MKQISKKAISLLTDKKSFALATIISQEVPGPRQSGANMMIMPDGSILGTIGGGLLENRVIELAADVIKTKRPYLLHYISDESAAQPGMACGGGADIFIDYVDAGLKINLDIYNELYDSLTRRQKVWFAQHILDNGDDALNMPCRQCVLKADGTTTGAYIGTDEDGNTVTNPCGYDVFTMSENRKTFILNLSNTGTVLIFGAGHVGEKLVPLLDSVGFETIVFDDRSDFANKKRFPHADKIIVLDSFKQDLFESFVSLRDCYIVIATRGHMHDKTVLTKALETDAFYIGMLGSRKKKQAIYNEILSKKGFTANDLKRIRSPIGLDIKANTPEEIAVSIAAQLILIRAGGDSEN